MPRPTAMIVAQKKALDSDFIREADRFFEARGEVHQTMRRPVKRLEKAGIPYAIIECLEEKRREVAYEALP